MIFLYKTEQFKTKIENKSFALDIEKKLEEIAQLDEEHLKSYGKLATFPNKIYVLKISSPQQSRTILERIQIGSRTIFFVRDIVVDKNFDHYWPKVVYLEIKNGIWVDNNPLSDTEKNQAIAEYDYQKKIDIKLPSLPQELTEWINDYQLDLKYEIYETEKWVEYTLGRTGDDSMADRDVKIFGKLVGQIVQEEENEKYLDLLEEADNIQTFTYIENTYGIIFSKARIEDDTYFLLHNAGRTKTQAEHWEKAIYLVIDNLSELEASKEYISRIGFRAYPKWALKNDDLWYSIQKNDIVSNLSLSPDQVNYLEEFTFPAYINGQAGSGKSTMLYYLFANAFYLKFIDSRIESIAFISENKLLLKDTYKSIIGLMTNNPSFEGLDIDYINSLDEYLWSFKNLLESIIPAKEKANFLSYKYLDFPMFKYLYQHNSQLSQSIINKFSAETVWFVIRTYLYGYNPNLEITSENFENEVPSKSRQFVDKRLIKDIEDNVLFFYKKLLNDGYWDNIKIIKYINSNKHVLPQYTAIFCDEAQDFCRVELDFILRLSTYLKYDLSPPQVKEIPIIFAGDQNQTVNPTGFRIEAIKDTLYNLLKEKGYDWDKNKINNKIYSPEFNYRSEAPVVRLANYIQYYRSKALNRNIKFPQDSKLPQSSDTTKQVNQNVFLVGGNIINNKELLERLKYKSFIIPVDTSEKETYVLSQPLLEYIQDEKEIQTPVEVKGAEYPQVVLYGFGKYYLNNFNKEIKYQKIDKVSLELDFFFNNLYVGITRAQSELIIIDSEDALEYFWKPITNFSKVTLPKWQVLTGEKIILFEAGSFTDNIQQSSPDEAIQNAHLDMKLGLATKNIDKLRVAANQFSKLGKKKECYTCHALINKIEGEHPKAGDYFEKAGNKEAAAQAFWEAKMFRKVAEYNNDLLGEKHEVRLITSKIYLGRKINNDDTWSLFRNKILFKELVYDLQWKEELISQFISFARKSEERTIKRDISRVIEEVLELNTNVWNLLAELYYEIEEWSYSLNAWLKHAEANDKELIYDDDCLSELEIDPRKYYLTRINFYKEKGDEIQESCFYWEIISYSKGKDVKEYERKILSIYNDLKQRNQIPFDDIFYMMSVCASMLLDENDQPFDEVAYKIEQLVEESKEFYSLGIEFYSDVLSLGRVNDEVFIFLIERLGRLMVLKDDKHLNKEQLEKFNTLYKTLSKIHKVLYKPFRISELIEIPKRPKKIKKKANNHLKTFRIKNFRKFKDLKLTNLGQFNLIVGDNNIGKTSLLEAFLLDENIEVLIPNLRVAYEDRVNSKEGKESDFIFDFFNSEIIDNETKRIKDGESLEFEIEESRLAWNYKLYSPSEERIRNKYPSLEVLNRRAYLALTINDEKEIIFNIKDILVNNIQKSAHFIPFAKGFGNDLAKQYLDFINTPKKKAQFVENLRCFIPNISQISARESGEIIIDLLDARDDEIGQSLHKFGEGANKLFRILIEITLCPRGGRVMIDEIDAGIHYSRFNNFWRAIIKVAKAGDVQIFATTHNLECITYFKEVLSDEDTNFSEYRNDSRVITIELIKGTTPKSFTRLFEEFEYELDENFEIRGGSNYE